MGRNIRVVNVNATGFSQGLIRLLRAVNVWFQRVQMAAGLLAIELSVLSLYRDELITGRSGTR